MPRLVRRRSFRERILSFLNPLDLALDLYTYIESYDWEGVQSTTSTPIGLALNLLLLVARVNSTSGASRGYEDVLRTTTSTSGIFQAFNWASGGGGNKLGYFLRYFSYLLAIVSVLNSLLCFTKKKRYRMFESNINIEPNTPNARRVPVDSSPAGNGITALLSPSKKTNRTTREYTPTTDVWEISVWDPTPLSLRLFSLFSPVHCAVYFLMFPITTASQYLFPNSPSGTASYVTALIIQAALSLQLSQLVTAFTQQAQDKAVVQKEVLREYDNKFVHPRLNVLKRDVSTQTKDDHFEASVEIFTPVFNRQGFVTHPNPNYQRYTTSEAGTTSGYSSTSGFAPSSIANTPQVERQLRREMNPEYTGSVRRFNRFLKKEPLEDDSPTKSDWSNKPRRFGANRNTGIVSSETSTMQDRERERERKEQREQRERIKRGSDAFSTIYPGLDDEKDDKDTDGEDDNNNSTWQSPKKPLTNSNTIVLNTPPNLPPNRRGAGYLSPVRPQTQDRIRGDIGTPRRPTFIGMSSSSTNTNNSNSNANVGMNGLVNMAVENSRSLSPTKVGGGIGSPMRSRPRTSSYAASLGKGAFTPKRER